MYSPNYQLSHHLINLLLNFENIKYKFENLEIKQNTINRLIFDNKVEAIFHLSHLLKKDITINQAERILEGREVEAEDEIFRLLMNFRSANDVIYNALKGDYLVFDTNFLITLNKTVLYSLKDPWDARYRFLSDTADNNYFWKIFENSFSANTDFKTEVASLIDFYRFNAGKIHPLIRSANFLYRLLKLRPMLLQNDITALLLAEFLLIDSKLFQYPILSVIKNISINEESYMSSWEFATKNQDDETEWIEKFIKNISEDFANIKEGIEVNLEERKKNKDQPFLDLNKRQLKILRYLQNIPSVKREEYCEMQGISTMTAFRDLNDLVKKKLLRIDGSGRGTKYLLYTR